MNSKRHSIPALAMLAAGTVLVAGCAGRTDTAGLREAQTSIDQAQADPVVQKYASVDLIKAQQALTDADKAAAAGEEENDVDHLAYIARQRAAIAQAKGQAGASRAQIDELGRQGPQIQLEAERQKVAALEQQLQAKQTDRGTMVTLGDVLFDTGRSTLKPGAAIQLSRLAEYLQDRRNASVTVEGHTDNTGSNAFNMQLSQERADTVKSALMANGVDPGRIAARGLGESLPVASNATAAGRQQNRRVEVIVQ